MITGLSGAGRTEAAKHLEDMGWFVIDNLPPALMPKVAELTASPGALVDRVALVIGTGAYRDEIVDALGALRSGSQFRVRTLFLEARTPVLVSRYEATRRRHPFMKTESLADAIEAERRALEALAEDADIAIDTSDLNVHQLRDRILDLFRGEGSGSGMQTRLVTFGYKHGLPLDVDMVVDCRFLPNPHWIDRLRSQNGVDPDVRDYVLGQPLAIKFLTHLTELLTMLVPAYELEGKAYLTLAFGCTGGRHRSVAIAEQVSEIMTDLGFPPSIRHRDLDRSVG